MIRQFKQQHGFTLVEVLIAAVILFSALAITADLYKASSLTSGKITNKANFYQATTNAISTIKAEIQIRARESKQAEFSGEYASGGINYKWQAIRTSFKARLKRVDEIDDPLPQFGLYDVTFIGQRQEGRPEQVTFKVATW